MGLREITIHRTPIEYRNQTFEVRGISASDLMIAAQDYGPQIALAFGKLQSGEMQGDTKKIILGLVRELPEVAGAVIALASDDYAPETVETASKLPINVQVEAIEAVFNETFYSEADVKKLIESLTRAMAAVSGAMTQVMPPPSPSGIGEFEDKQAS